MSQIPLLLAHSFSFLPPQLATLLIAMIPVGELRGGIPVGVAFFHLPLWEATVFAILGTMVPIYFILWLLEDISNWLRKHFTIFEKFFSWLFHHTHEKMQKYVEKYGALGLGIVAAIPIPILGGAWTAALAAFVFGIEKKKAFWIIFGGTIIAGIIVASLTEAGTLAIKTVG